MCFTLAYLQFIGSFRKLLASDLINRIKKCVPLSIVCYFSTLKGGIFLNPYFLQSVGKHFFLFFPFIEEFHLAYLYWVAIHYNKSIFNIFYEMRNIYCYTMYILTFRGNCKILCYCNNKQHGPY